MLCQAHPPFLEHSQPVSRCQFLPALRLHILSGGGSMVTPLQSSKRSGVGTKLCSKVRSQKWLKIPRQPLFSIHYIEVWKWLVAVLTILIEETLCSSCPHCISVLSWPAFWQFRISRWSKLFSDQSKLYFLANKNHAHICQDYFLANQSHIFWQMKIMHIFVMIVFWQIKIIFADK